jgi:hypothetical protein
MVNSTTISSVGGFNTANWCGGCPGAAEVVAGTIVNGFVVNSANPSLGWNPRTDCDNHHTRLSRANQLYGYRSRADLCECWRNLLHGDSEYNGSPKLGGGVAICLN